MSDRFGLAVVGLGMGSKPHALALQALSGSVEVIGAHARSEPSRAAFAEAYGFPVTGDVEALANDPRVDAVLLLTPPNARKELVELFAGNGKPILMEKPVERDTAAATAIVETCEAAGVPLGIVFQHRFRAASEKLAALLAEGALGEIRLARADIEWWRGQEYYDEPGRGTYERDGGGVLISQAIHTMDLMLSLTGPVAAVQALCATTPIHRMESEDFCAGALEFESGAVGSLFASTACFPGSPEGIRLDCDRASAVLRRGTLTIHWRDGRTESFGEAATTGGGADPMAFPFQWHQSVIEDFVAAVRDGGAPRVTGREALRVHRLIAALEASSREGRKVSIGEA